MEAIIEELRKRLNEQEILKADVQTRRIVVKDALIPYFLKFIYDHKSYRQLAFYGGSCARVVYGFNRMSEDIDLDNSFGVDMKDFGRELNRYIRGGLRLKAGEVYAQSGDIIRRWTVRLPILFDLGLSKNQSEKLHVKVEVSPQKQTAIIVKTPVVCNGKSMVIIHWSRETLMAGKLIACLERGAARDWFDLIWYMQQQVRPLDEKLLKDAKVSRTTSQAISELAVKVKKIKPIELITDLMPLFNERVFVEEWVKNFKEWFKRYGEFYKTAA